MLKKSLLIALILLLNACAGTIRLAQDTDMNTQSSTTPSVTKSTITKPKE